MIRMKTTTAMKGVFSRRGWWKLASMPRSLHQLSGTTQSCREIVYILGRRVQVEEDVGEADFGKSGLTIG